MAILRSNGIIEVTSIPLHTPTGNEATIARLTDTLTYYIWNGSSWDTVAMTPSEAETKPIGVYKATLNQETTDIPIATVLVNTFVGTLSWSYVNVGEFLLTSTLPEFIAGRTIINIPYAVDGVNTGVTGWSWIDASNIKLYTFVGPTQSSAPADDILAGTNGVPISIEVWEP